MRESKINTTHAFQRMAILLEDWSYVKGVGII